MKYRLQYYFFKTIHKISYALGLISKERYKSRKNKYRIRYNKALINLSAKEDYLNYLLDQNHKRKPESFVDIDETNFVRRDSDTKIIAWYLPQFHQIDVNNKFHGQGFTEWTNVTRAIPAFVGHYQPHIPYDVGFYDLLNPDTFKRQIELATKYGIYAFCFHWYWFSGKRTMEKPLELFLKHKEFNIKFCINWANENWSTLWDGGNKDLIFEQKLQEGDDEKFFNDILPYMKDERYVRINGAPLLSIYRPQVFGKDRFIALTQKLRNLAVLAGFPDLYIVITNAFDFSDNPSEWHADALVEFPAFGVRADRLVINGYINPYFHANVFDYAKYCREKKYLYPHNANVYYRSAMISFDNTARKGFSNNGSVFLGSTPLNFQANLEDIIFESTQIHSSENNIVFINSWNEWAEGSHLEPDHKYGYAYLKAVRNALEKARTPLNISAIENCCEGISNPKFVINCVESLGDIIACEPIVRYLKGKFQNCYIAWIISEKFKDAIKFNPNINEIITVSTLLEADRQCEYLHREKDFICVDLHYNGRPSAGGGIHSNTTNSQINEYNYYSLNGILSAFSLIAGLPPLHDSPIFWLNPGSEISAFQKFSILSKYIVIHTKPSESIKEWPTNKWFRLINELINSGHTIIEVGLENTIKIHNSHFFATANYNCTFHENAALVKRASLFIGVDSCFAHIANCFNVPSVILLGSYKSFGKHTPFSNYRANRIEIYKHEISAIQETEVLNAAFTVQKF